MKIQSMVVLALSAAASLSFAGPAQTQSATFTYCIATSPRSGHLFSAIFSSGQGISEIENAWKAYVNRYRGYGGEEFSDANFHACPSYSTSEEATRNFQQTWRHYRGLGQAAHLSGFQGQ